ncbi:uncharacterized protein IL334_001373 [Kwoniella shivajii]|uniref:YCII-related domain-containing protein n=1 Tax=Kwoniella shivajii TaxID=564305 RepID=A0ABZ1CS05_9TREE|nr:hypothetical protein IL334_001373 [Kwoniella shivajii]
MPLYICFCPDESGAFEKRVAARGEHLALGQKDRAAGRTVFGRAFLDDTVAHHTDRAPPAVPEGHLSPATRGSTMIYRYATLEEAWKRLKSDPYWVQGVWDKGKVTINELAYGPSDETLKMA